MHASKATGDPRFPGVTNFRDFGGLPAADGVTRRDRLYRSGHFDAASPAVRSALAGFDFQLIADLRFEAERRGRESPWAVAPQATLLAPAGNSDGEAPHVRLLKSPTLDEAMIAEFYKAFYAQVPFDPVFRPVFSEFLDRLSRIDGRALIHCSIGKDRTGILAAIVAASLGVTRDAIMADYLRSRDAEGLAAMVPDVSHILKAQLGHEPPPDVAAKLLSVDADYLDSAFKAIEDRAGSVDAYLDGLGCDADRRRRLRQRLVE